MPILSIKIFKIQNWILLSCGTRILDQTLSMQCLVAPHSRDCLNPPPHQYDGPHVHRDAPTISCTAAAEAVPAAAAAARSQRESDNRSRMI